ncbi:MAG TPA: matrixin family metalloprotease [Chthoniobacterales bacterium]|jgi:hypothetical protein|nr:matrixin family metalloprotease [Chthoniobacterales bacterium]
MTPINTPSGNSRALRICGPLAALGSLFVIAFGTFQASTAVAYVLEGAQWPNGSTVVMQLSMGNAGRTLSDGNTSWNAAVAPALDNWNAVVARMQFGKVMNSTAAVSQGDRVNSMAFASTFFGQSFGSNTLAITGYWMSGSTITEADILFNSSQSWDSYRGPLRSGVYDVQRVALHESGHALGMAHSSQSSAIMYAYINNSYQLTADDISGAQSMYGAATGSPTPTPTPIATATPTPTPRPTATPTATPSATITPTPTPVTGVAVTLSVSQNSLRSGGSATFTVNAARPVASNVTVGFQMSGSAFQGSNYSLSASQFNIPAGSSSASITLNVSSAAKRSKTATMNLTTGSGYTLSSPSSASVSMRR